MEIQAFATYYCEEIVRILNAVDRLMIKKIVEIIALAYQKQKQIFVFGNGGSAATASHFAIDLNKGILGHEGNLKIIRFKVICLNDNIPTMTAWANDSGFENIFAEQLKNFARKGDLAIGISASGNSPNIVKCLKVAKEMGVKTIAFVGFDGGKAQKIANYALLAPINHYGLAEDIHSIFCHLIANYFIQELGENAK